MIFLYIPVKRRIMGETALLQAVFEPLYASNIKLLSSCSQTNGTKLATLMGLGIFTATLDGQYL